ncbi:MAG: T9SS type A sorting domain-containing protein, partial [Croceitalea sp.]|nr:T9SS type A sorting domain-containing protein [Croceitalea sp.]
QSQLDDDGDGVTNDVDSCPNTVEGLSVNANGCAESQLDSDNDGISNNLDQCPNTPLNQNVDINGCSQSQLDDDGDGVANNLDQCPNTIEGILVNEQGCEIIEIPKFNFTISTIGTSCRGSFDGQILIKGILNLGYNAKLTATSFSETKNFKQNLLITDLPSGSYDLCLTIPGNNDYEFCSKVVIASPPSITVFSSFDSNTESVTLKMNGGSIYTVSVNGKSFKTENGDLTLNLTDTVNKVEISTDKPCQGVYEEVFIISEQLAQVYPNPFVDKININNINLKEGELEINLFEISGKKVKYEKISDWSQINQIEFITNGLSKGIYLLRLEQNGKTQQFKLIKQ